MCNSTQLNSTQLNSTQLNSTQLNSTQLNSTQLNSTHFCIVRFTDETVGGKIEDSCGAVFGLHSVVSAPFRDCCSAMTILKRC